MLQKLGALRSVFTPARDAHPLLDPRESRKLLGELPKDNAFRALDEIVAWLESLQAQTDCPADQLYAAACQLDQAAQPHVQRLAREYLGNLRLARADERRLWSINHAFWLLLADAYERCGQALAANASGSAPLKAQAAALCTRTITALGGVLKWEAFHYGPMCANLWGRLGQPLLLAEKLGVANESQADWVAPHDAYLRCMLFQVASVDSLLPLEIELAERLIGHFLHGFCFSADVFEDIVYWVDLLQGQAPQRLFWMPEKRLPSQRYFKPGSAHGAMLALLQQLEQGADLPPNLSLGGQYYAATVLPVLRHLSLQLAPLPPQRAHDRHAVKHRMAVLHGLPSAFAVFPGESPGRSAGLAVESWVVENVSRGGFGALVGNVPGDWIRVGALLSMQPEGGENWVLGVVRRYYRESESEARVGIQLLGHQVRAVELKPRTASNYAAMSGEPALLIEGQSLAGEVRLIRVPATFDSNERLEYILDGRRCKLNSVALLEQTADYKLARYRCVSDD